MRYAIEDVPLEMEAGGICTRGVEGGALYLRHIELPGGVDFTPLFVGLPHDLCPCPHWGQVLSGAITVRFADGTEETCRDGDIYYWPGGHTGWTEGGVTFLEISPTGQILPVLDHLSRAMAAATA